MYRFSYLDSISILLIPTVVYLRIRFPIRGRYFNQEQCEAGYKAKSHLRGEREAVSGSWRDVSPQRLRDSPRPSRASTSIDPASEPESRADKAMRLRRHDRTAGRASLRESQERIEIGLGRKKVRPPLDA